MYSELRTKLYDATVGTSGLNNRLYYTEAPQDTGITPYAVFYLINQETIRADSESTEENFTIQYNIFSDIKTTAKTMENITEAIIIKLDSLKSTLAISGYDVLDYKKDFVLPAQKVEGYWTVSIQYSLLIDKIN